MTARKEGKREKVDHGEDKEVWKLFECNRNNKMVYGDQRLAGIEVDSTGRHSSKWTVVHKKEKVIDNRI
jgi:hypothetical protein